MSKTAAYMLSRTAGSIFARWPGKRHASRIAEQQGFSLPETLVALLLFSLSSLALTQYQLALGRSFQLQLQQREALRLARQRFEGYQAPGWQATLAQQAAENGCVLLTASVISPLGARAELTQLHCLSAEPDSVAAFPTLADRSEKGWDYLL